MPPLFRGKTSGCSYAGSKLRRLPEALTNFVPVLRSWINDIDGLVLIRGLRVLVMRQLD